MPKTGSFRCGSPSWLATLAALLASACLGAIDEMDAPADPADEPSSPIGSPGQPADRTSGGPPASPGAAPPPEGVAPALVRRLTTTELGNAFQALVGFRPAALGQIPKDGRGHLFDRVAQGQTVTLSHLEAFLAVADEVADRLTPQRLGTIVPACATSSALPADGDALARSRRPCVERLVDELGPRVFRRAVEPGKRAALLALYDGAGTYADGLRQVVHALFGSAEFLYLVERGTPVPGKPGVLRLTDMEIATRLSLFLCETIPAADPQLLAAASAGQLGTPDRIAAHAARLFEQPCARATVTKFFTQWFDTEKILDVTRDAKLFPLFTARARQALVREQEELARHVTFEQRGRLADLFTATYSFLDRDSAPVYGLASTSATPQRMELPPQRRGLLTQAALLTLTSPSQTKTSPVIRGAFVLHELLCQELPPAPADVPPLVDDGRGTAAGLARAHAADPACAGCHSLIDPVGFALEEFDTIGAHRTADRGVPIDPTGGIPMVGIENGKLRGGAELALALSRLPELRACFARQWFRFGLARLEGEADARALWELVELGRRESPLREVMLGLVRTHAFSHRAVAP